MDASNVHYDSLLPHPDSLGNSELYIYSNTPQQHNSWYLYWCNANSVFTSGSFTNYPNSTIKLCKFSWPLQEYRISFWLWL